MGNHFHVFHHRITKIDQAKRRHHGSGGKIKQVCSLHSYQVNLQGNMKEIFKLHGMPREIVSDRDTKFTSSFWKSLMVGFENKLLFSTTYHPQTDGQIERINQILEDMLRIHVMQ